jgi:hypothetical protein
MRTLFLVVLVPLLTLLFSLLGGLPTRAAVPLLANSHPIARGTFIQEYLARDWTDEQWLAEFRYLREVGMEYLVFGSTADSKARVTYYPTQIPGYHLATGYADTLDACLRNAQKAGFKVFLGLNFHDAWWQKSANDPEWLQAQMADGNAIAKELWQRYGSKYPRSLYGWYWVWEVDNLNFRTPAQVSTLAKAIDTNVRFLKTLTPEKPVMLCPFMNYRLGTPDQYRQVWESIFAQCALGPGDIFCPQDCVGAGGLRLEDVPAWFRALKSAVATKPGLRFWSDTETFVQEDWTSATIGRFVEQLKVVQPIVELSITFAYSHYYSPSTVGPGFHRTYREYVQTGTLETKPPTAPTDFQGERRTPSGYRLRWHRATDNQGIAGYYIYRNGTLISRLQIGKSKTPDEREILDFVDDKPGDALTLHYTIQAYDFAGNVSALSPPVSPPREP